ncbi:iron complex outermembrane receptor protein [Tahibacter aquaticus]|uniref:Iron complex outermembrane receptor protein n=1 Tax=Tahibacter aquaticus TaxID=520092 RepID=A0A4R6YUV2_9GAMM|nr:TonB-dependent receptor [Tahibacter aquaticus]TDR42427.1 iron complex outermembrane receptor protein [Tahibacter aquaticus]
MNVSIPGRGQPRAALYIALIAALSAVPVHAQSGKTGDERLETINVISTGTRAGNRSDTDTAAPVDVIGKDAIEATGALETGKLLQKLAPSFNFPTNFVSDGTDLVWPATLRGLGPDQVLVLVNGKRRHQQSLVNVQQTIGRGSAGTDINSIPIASIERIEVLRDGASAQYGSDAIAGVINIILKDQTDHTDVGIEIGQTYAGDGDQYHGSLNTGFKLGEEGFLNLTLDYTKRLETNRAGPDSLRVDPPRVTQRLGEADMEGKQLWINSEIPLAGGKLYAFGGISKREGNSSGFFRSAGDGRTIPQLYPNGFLPILLTTTDDRSLAVGYRHAINDAWSWDFSVNRGWNQFEFASEGTANVSYYYEPKPGGGIYGETPTSAQDGTLRFKQTTANFDLKGSVDWGIGAEPLYLAFGSEWRRDGYQIIAGDPVSYQYGRTNDPGIEIRNAAGGIAAAGIQGFPGFTPGTEIDASRRSFGIYVDAESYVTRNLLIGAAGRFEDYSDFGTNSTGKLSLRYNFTDTFSLRGTVSKGFRAPSVQQQFFSQVSTNLNANGVLTDTITARQGSPAALAFGIKPLKEESSNNYSLGFVWKPSQQFSLTADLYQISIDDRIVFSSAIGPEAGSENCTDPTVCPIALLLRPLNVGQATFFTNAVDTKTRGLDIVGEYVTELQSGARLGFSAALDFNKTEVLRVNSPSSVLPSSVLFAREQVTLIEEGQPRQRVTLGTNFHTGPWHTDLAFNYYGSVSGEGFTPGLKQKWGGKWLTDLSVSYNVTDDLRLTLGGNNIFDVYPDKWESTGPDQNPFPYLGFKYGWETLPFGLNGGYYYARVAYRF